MPQAATVSENNKRIAKNTLMLYVKMAFTTFIGIFATRVLLQALGADDYGLVTVIGGVVTMFAFLSGTMSSSCSRFFNFELGQKNTERLKQTFNLTQLIYFGLVVILLLLSETVGLWFLENKVVIPPERADAAFWFFQFSVVTFLLSTLSIPYSALIISHENIKTFAWITIFEAVARLGIIYLLSLSSFDKLAFYGALLMIIGIIHFSLNYLVCRLKYPESRFAFFWDRHRFVEIAFFGIWNLGNALSGALVNLLLNVLLNNFFGAAVTAARGIALQVSASLMGFTQSILLPSNPQITKYYASGDCAQAQLLSMRTSFVGFILLFFFVLPAWLLLPFVFELWLEEIPAYAICFTRLVLIQSLVDVFACPLVVLVQASGKVAVYQSLVGGTLWFKVLFSWCGVVFWNISPEVVFFNLIIVSCFALLVQVFLLERCVGLIARRFWTNVVFPALKVSVVATIVPAWVAFFVIPNPSWRQFFVVGASSVVSVILSVFLLGITRSERCRVLNVVFRR